MAVTKADEIIQDINSKIDPEKLSYLINYFPEKVQITPAQVKCFCPLHNEQAFRSLIFEVKNHTYRCTMKRCKGFDGGTFVEFWCLLTEKAPLESALELAEKLKLDVDVAALRALGSDLIGKARKALGEGDLGAARAFIEQAVAFDPKSIDAGKLSAEIHFKGGDRDSAFEEYAKVIDLAIAAADYVTARGILGPLATTDPKNIEFAQRRVTLAQAENDKKSLAQALLKMAEIYGETGSVSSELSALDELIGLVGEEPTVLEKVADIHKNAERTNKMVETLERLTPLYQAAGNWAKVRETLERRLQVSTGDADAKEQLAAALFKLNDGERGAQIILRLSDEYRATGGVLKAQALLKDLLSHLPEHVVAIERLATLAAESGHRKEAVEAYRRLAEIARKAEKMDDAARYLGRARAIDPDDYGLRRDLAETQLSQNNMDEGIAELFGLADVYLTEADPSEGFTLLQRISELVPDDLTRQLEIGRCLETAGYDDKALESYGALVKRLQGRKAHEDALRVCKEARRMAPRSEHFLEASVESMLALGRKAEALGVLREAARSYLDVDNIKLAETFLQRAAKIDPNDPTLKMDWAQVCERGGRPAEASRLWNEVAQFYRTAGNTNQALVAAREVLRLDADNIEAKSMLAQALEANGEITESLLLWKGVAETLLTREPNSPKVIRVYQHVLELAPDDLEIIPKLATLQYRVEGPEPAKALFSQWVDKTGRTQDAAAQFTAVSKAVELYPKDLTWRSLIADLLVKRGDGQHALPHLEQLLSAYRELDRDGEEYQTTLNTLVDIVPERLDVRLEWADSIARAGDVDRASPVFAEIAQEYLSRGEAEKGLQTFLKALAYQEENRELLMKVAELYERLGKKKEAIGAYERLVDLSRRLDTWRSNVAAIEKLLMLSPDRFDLRDELGRTYESHGDIENAIEQYQRIAQVLIKKELKSDETLRICEKLVELAPDRRECGEMLVDCCIARKNIERAKTQLDRMGDVALKEGDLARAEALFRRIQEVDPQDIGAGERLGKLYEARGEIDQAADTYRQVLALYEKKKDVERIVSVLGHLKDLAPKDLELRQKLARTLSTIKGREDDAAVEWYDLICTAIPMDKVAEAKAALKEGDSFFEQRWDYRFKIIQLFERVMDPAKNAKAWREFAEKALKADQNHLAREAASEGLEQAPEDVALYELRIKANMKLEDTAAAESDLRELANQHVIRDEHEKAEGFFIRALEFSPDASDLIAQLAQSQLQQGKTDEGCATLRRLAESFRAQGDLDAAIERAREIGQHQPKSIAAKDYLIELLFENGLVDEAVKILAESGQTLTEAGDLAGAILKYAEILKHRERDIATLRRVADLTRDTKGSDVAAEHYHRLLDVMMEDSKPKAIESEFQRVLELEADQLSLAEKYATYLFNSGKNRKSAAEFMRIAKVYEESLGEMEEALRVIRVYQALDPTDLDAMEADAALLQKMGRKDEAVGVLRGLASAYAEAGSQAKTAGAIARCAELLGDDAVAQVEAAHAWQGLKETEKATNFFVRAVRIHEANGDAEAAVPLMERVNDLNPTNTDFGQELAKLYEQTGQSSKAVSKWLSLGELFEKSGEADRALDVYRHTKSIAADELEPRRRIARVATETGDVEGALREYREMISVALGLGEDEETIAILKRILELNASDTEAMLALADQYRRMRMMDELFDALMTLEAHYSESNKLAEAAKVMEELRALRPDDIELTRRVFDLQIRLGDKAEAARLGILLVETHLEHNSLAKAKEMILLTGQIEPEDIDRRATLARMAEDAGHPELALEEFRNGAVELAELGAMEPALKFVDSGLMHFADDVPLRRTRIGILKAVGQADAAIEAQLSLASLFENKGEEAESFKTLDEILLEHPESIATHQCVVNMALKLGDNERTADHLIQLAEIHYAMGDVPESINALQQLLELQPDRTELRTRLAELHFEAGNTSQARDVWMQAAREHRDRGNVQPAIDIYERMRENNAQDAENLSLLSECYAELGNDEKYLEHALELCEIYAQTGETDRTCTTLEKLAERFPKNLSIWERLATAYAEEGRNDDAVRCHLSLHDLHESTRRYDLAKNSLEQALQLRSGDATILNKLGEICLRLNLRPEGLEYLGRAAETLKDQGQFDEARAIIERIMKLDPANLEVRRVLGSLCEAMSDDAGAIKNYSLAARGWAEKRNHDLAIPMFEHLLKLDSNLTEDREQYAHVLEREGRTGEACDQYLKLIDQLGTEGDPRQVIRYCRQIIKEAPDRFEAHAHLYRVYEATNKPRLALEEAQWLADYFISIGDMEQAEDYIRRGLAQVPGEIELRKRYVEILIETHRQDEAAANLKELAASAQQQGDLRTARWALMRASETMPENMDYRNQLAQLLENAGEHAEARRVRMEVVGILLGQGELEKAKALADRVVETAPNDEPLRTSVAQVFEEAGLPEVASFHLIFLSRRALERGEQEEVRKLTDHVLQMKPRNVDAREVLVEALTKAGDIPGACHYSRELYTIYLESDELENAQKSLKDIIQHKPSDPEPRRLLVALLRKMNRPDAVAEQLRKLSEICANEGDVESSVAALRELLQVKPDDTRARARYIDLYSQMGDESELYEDFLHLARTYRAKGKIVEALQVYEKLMQTHAERHECREQFVDFLFEQGQVNRGIEESRSLVDLYLQKDLKVEAGRSLEKALSKSPQDMQMRHQLATLQIRTNRRGLALETLRGLLRQYEQDNDETKQIEVTTLILEIDPQNVELRQRLAELHVKAGQGSQAREQRMLLAQQYLDRQLFDLAEREYQRILEVNPQDIEVWQAKIRTHMQIGGEMEVVPDMVSMAGMMVQAGRADEAVQVYMKLRELQPQNIEVMQKYIEAYKEVGMEEELVDDYLQLATLLSQAGRVEEAMPVYLKLQELSPENSQVRARIQSGGAPATPTARKEQTHSRPLPVASTPTSQVPLDMAMREAEFGGNGAPLTAPVVSIPVGSVDAGLEKQIRNYENILKLNPDNPAVRTKLAELIAKTGRMKEADEQWAQAANDFMNRGDFNRSIEILTELVNRHPDDARLRERLSRAVLKRESLNAIGSIVDIPGTNGNSTRS